MKIPRNIFQEGIDLCKKNVLNYLNEAEIIAQKDHLHHAYVLVQLAIEELGKIVWLMEELQNSLTDPVDVPNVIFGKDAGKSHWKKHKKALGVLNPDFLWVCTGAFDPTVFDPKVFDVGREASPEIRLLNAYVGFNEKRKEWCVGCDIDKSRLNALICHMKQVVSAL